MGGAVAKRLLEPIDDLSPIIGREPLVGDGGPCDVATELFELSCWAASQTVAAWSEKPGCPASKVDGKGEGCAGTVRKVNAFPAGVGANGDPVMN